jgi:Zn-dependent peptidase ImmA (M78 family)/transcriptional regulator with XRE-family HTH domain
MTCVLLRRPRTLVGRLRDPRAQIVTQLAASRVREAAGGLYRSSACATDPPSRSTGTRARIGATYPRWARVVLAAWCDGRARLSSTRGSWHGGEALLVKLCSARRMGTMNATAFTELGRRLLARRQEAHLSPAALAQRANVALSDVEAFEAGGGGLGASALVRLARALGVPEGSFLHTSAPEVPAHREPSFLLKEVAQGATLSLADRTALTAQLYQARAYAELGQILGSPCLAEQFQPRPAKQKQPYLAGYDLAHTVRKLIGNEHDPLRELRSCIEDRFNILVVEHRFDDARIQAAACRSGAARLIAISTAIGFEPARRAVLGHELAHHLADLTEDDAITDRDVHDDHYSTQRPPEEQRASAFSIMLLAPRKTLSATLGPRKLGREEAPSMISSCRLKYGVGFEAMTWHLFHLGHFDFSEDVAEELAHEDDGLDVSGFEAPAADVLSRRIDDALARHSITEGRARLLRDLSLS